MNIFRRTRRFAAALAGLAAALVAFATPAFAVNYPPPASGHGAGVPTPPPPVVHTVIVGGMPVLQIALIEAGAPRVSIWRTGSLRPKIRSRPACL